MRTEMTIEVYDGDTSAVAWASAFQDRLIEIASGYGMLDFRIVQRSWGLVLELAFADDNHWEAFRRDPSVLAALDMAPRVLISRGWGGSAGARVPRRPKPFAGAGAAELPLPEPDVVTDATGTWRERVRELVGAGLLPRPA